MKIRVEGLTEGVITAMEFFVGNASQPDLGKVFSHICKMSGDSHLEEVIGIAIDRGDADIREVVKVLCNSRLQELDDTVQMESLRRSSEKNKTDQTVDKLTVSTD